MLVFTCIALGLISCFFLGIYLGYSSGYEDGYEEAHYEWEDWDD